jgi:cytochrome P450
MLVALPGILPNILAPRAVAGREAVVSAMDRYYASGGHYQASQLTMARYTALKGTMDIADIARSECVHGLAVISNLVTAAFWTVWHVFSDPAVLSRVRDEVKSLAAIGWSSIEDTRTRIVNVGRLKEAQFLFAVIQETLRIRARGTGPRMVLDDITLSGDECEYHIEKGSVLIIAHEGMHHNKAIWGLDADTFVADRFLPGSKIPTNAFRGFGGGANTCPGKGFATAEIAALVAMMVTSLDLRPAGGRWAEPGQDESNMAREHTPPLRKVMVNVIPRAGVKNVI